jgi:iron complex outermembrane recepter protein
MKSRVSVGLASASLLMIAGTAHAQTGAAPGASDAGFELEEIVVTARRKDESLQDVPTTINAVSGEELQKLNIRQFADIASVVPGLSMVTNGNGIGATASVRGVNYDVNASGNNGTIEFYQNDAPISASNLFQTVYDIQQVELLRGPQGTLRGRASPSGSMTVITKRPDLQELGGNVAMTANNIGGYNVQGGVGIPIISDVLAVRVAAAYDKSEANRVVSLNNPADPYAKTKSGRVTVRFEPTDSLSFILTAQKTKLDSVVFDQVASAKAINPNAPAYVPPPGGIVTDPYITPGQRLSVSNVARTIGNDFNNYNFQAQWAFAGQKLNYVGARNEQEFISLEPRDLGDYYPSNYQAFLNSSALAQPTTSHSYATAHELRLSNEERVFGMFDYLFGAFTQKTNVPTTLTSPSVIFFSATPTALSNALPGIVSATPIARGGGTKESSGFVNLTAHVGDALELSGGARYIKYEVQSTLAVNGSRLAAADENKSFNTTIWTASAKYNFTDKLMAYVSAGSSWRPGLQATGDFSANRSPLEQSFVVLEPEKSTSFEAGIKASMFDNRLHANASVFHQKFDNYPYRSASGIFYVSRTQTATPGVYTESMGSPPFNFVAAVPVEVNGVEAEVNFAATKSWDMGVSAAVSKGEIKGGLIPCNDLNADGIPDASPVPPASVAAFRAAAGLGLADTLSSCKVTQSSSSAPQWSSVLQSEYRLPITSSLTTFARGQMSVYGNSGNDPTNSVDDYKSYQLTNLYLGVRDASGAWEVALYGKNVTGTERVLSTSSTTYNGGYRILNPTTFATVGGGAFSSDYYGGNSTAGMVMTPPREFGLTVRYAFGSK